jgi:hypothetical protein
MLVLSNSKDVTASERSHLIEEVRIRRALWNINDANHSNRQILAQLWLDVKVAMDTEERTFTGLILHKPVKVRLSGSP